MVEIRANRHYLHRPACKMTSVFRFAGLINSESFEKAIELAMNKHELLCSTVYRNDDGVAYYKYEPGTKAQVKLSVEKYEPADPEDEDIENMLDIAKEWLNEEEKVLLDIRSGEFMHHGIFTDGVETVWAISSHFLAGDFLSIKIFAKEVLEIYESILSNKHKNVDTSFIAFEEDNFNLDAGIERLSFPIKRQIKRLNKNWQRQGARFDWEDFEKIHKNFHEAYSIKKIFDTIDGDTTQVILQESIKTNISLDSLLAAAFQLASRENESFAFPLSTRIESNKSFGQFSGSITLERAGGFLQNDLLTNAKKIDSRLNEKLEAKNSDEIINRSNILIAAYAGTLIDSAYYAAFDGFKNTSAGLMQKIFSLDKAGEGMQINNLGDINFESENLSLRETYFVPSFLPNFRRVIAFDIVGDNLCLSSSFYQDDKVEYLIFEKVKDLLQDFAQSKMKNY